MDPKDDKKVDAEVVAELQSKLDGVVSEIKTLREAKAQAEADRDALKLKLSENNPAPAPTDDVDARIKKVFEEEKKENVGKNKLSAEAKFRAEHSEFSEENDPGGIKFAKLQQKVARFNTDGLSTEQDFVQLFEEALILVDPSKVTQPAGTRSDYASSPANAGGSPKSASTTNLSSSEKDVIKRLGWTEEQYLKQKEKRPAYISRLLQNLRG